MTAEAELLLINASRAQLVREIIRPALARGEIVLCDRFYDSTTAYQGWGRQLDLEKVKSIIDFAVEDTRPDLTLLLEVPIEVSEIRRQTRLQTPSTSPSSATSKSPPKVEGSEPVRDRMEEGDRAFFKRVQRGFEAIATEEPARVRVIDGTQPIEAVAGIVWREVEKILQPRPTPSVR
jgi:dTMP kinase